MKIIVKAKPGAKEESIKELAGGIGGDKIFEVKVKEPPVQGRANAGIAKALAAYFGVSNSQVRLISGFTSRQKIFEIMV